jgi:single-strand DNA-binding protein
MKGNNLVILRGNLGSDPTARPVPGETLTELSLATHAHWRDSQGVLQERTDWHRITVHGVMADWALRALGRGDQILVLGSLRPRTWQQSDGKKRTAVSVRAWEVQRLAGRSRHSVDPNDSSVSHAQAGAR